MGKQAGWRSPVPPPTAPAPPTLYCQFGMTFVSRRSKVATCWCHTLGMVLTKQRCRSAGRPLPPPYAHCGSRKAGGAWRHHACALPTQCRLRWRRAQQSGAVVGGARPSWWWQGTPAPGGTGPIWRTASITIRTSWGGHLTAAARTALNNNAYHVDIFMTDTARW